MDIVEEEELERISGLLQRDSLVRGLGIVEHVYRLLHSTPGTVGVTKSDGKGILPLVSETCPHVRHCGLYTLCTVYRNSCCLKSVKAT